MEWHSRASRHTYNATQIVSCIEEVEEKLDAAGFTERERIGTIVNVVSGGPRAASYNGNFVATFAKLVRRADGWHLIEADTDQRHAGKGAGERIGILITQSTAEAVQKRVLAGFIVREPKRPAIVSEAA